MTGHPVLFSLVVQSFVGRSTLITNLYRVPPYNESPLLRSCFIVLFIEPNNCEGHLLRYVLLLVGYLLQSSYVGGCFLDIKCPCVSLLWPIH